MVNRVDIQHFLDMRLPRARSRTAADCCCASVAIACRYPRGTRLAMGNALIARMATLAFRKGMQLRLNVNVLSLSERNGEVTGVEIEHEGQKQALEARCGWYWRRVVLPQAGWLNAIAPDPRALHHVPPPPTTAPRCAFAAAVNAREGADLPSNFSGPVSVYSIPTARKSASLIWSPIAPNLE